MKILVSSLMLLLLVINTGCISPIKNTNPEPQNEQFQMQTLDSFEIVPFGPYRFIGKSVYPSPWGRDEGWLIDGVWERSDWVFEELDNLKDYATDETRHFALMTWEKYDEKTKLSTYTVGRFMKPGTPVPAGMNYFDIEATSVAQGFIKSKNASDWRFADAAERPAKEAINQHNHNQTSWKWYAEAYPAGHPKNPVRDENGDLLFGTYISCEKK